VRILAVAATLIFFSCSQEKPVRSVDGSRAGHPSTDASATSEDTTPIGNGHGEKQFNDVLYSVSVIPATEFLQRKGERVAPEDRKSLSQETVLMLEFALADSQKDIWKYTGMRLSDEDAAQYLTGQLAADIVIEQGGKEWQPTGSSFEGRNGAVNKIRVQLFFGNIDCKQPLKVRLYDQLFGAGLIKFGINERQ
jgi:hypothetical protein